MSSGGSFVLKSKLKSASAGGRQRNDNVVEIKNCHYQLSKFYHHYIFIYFIAFLSLCHISLCTGYSSSGRIFSGEVHSFVIMAKKQSGSGYTSDHTFIPPTSQQSIERTLYQLRQQGHRTHGESD